LGPGQGGHLAPGLIDILREIFAQPIYPLAGAAHSFGKGISQTLPLGSASVVLMGNVDGALGADLVWGTFPTDNTSSITWAVAPSWLCLAKECLGPSHDWGRTGPVGDLYRLGDTNRDGRADLVFADSPGYFSAQEGDPTPYPLVWSVSTSTGASFRAAISWHPAGGQDGDVVP
jgi:hypothetical protein